MNPYNTHFEKLSDGVTTLKGKLYHISTALRNYSGQYANNLMKVPNIPDFALGSYVVISDLTHFGQKGIPRVYPCPGRHIVKLSDYETETNDLIIRERSFAAAYCFERLESFLKDILLEYYINRTVDAQELKLFSDLPSENPADIRMNISMRNGKNNINLLRTIRKITPNFEKFEKENIRGVDFTLWYKVFAIFRHSIVHMSGRLPIASKEYQSLDNLSRLILSQHFPNETGDHELKFMLEHEHGEKVFRMTCEYGFQVYKALSCHDNYEWKILKNMKNSH